jgi:lipopolysaccharide transport system permease protein
VSVLEKTVPATTVEPEAPRDSRVTVIRPATRLPKLDVRELWRYRELAGTFVWRDIKIRYKQTFIGVAWAVLQPLITTVIFTLIFGRYANFPSDNLPYPLFVLAGVLPWTYFQSSLNGASASIAGNRMLITKVYFPRVLLPLGSIATPLVDFLIALPVLAAMIVWFHIPVGFEALLFPFFVLVAAIAALGAGLAFTVAAVRYRDVPYAIPFVIQIWMFLSPVFYTVNGLQARYQWALSLNPMTGVISGIRWSLLGATAPSVHVVAIGTVSALVMLTAGLAFFRNAEPRFADTI